MNFHHSRRGPSEHAPAPWSACHVAENGGRRAASGGIIARWCSAQPKAGGFILSGVLTQACLPNCQSHGTAAKAKVRERWLSTAQRAGSHWPSRLRGGNRQGIRMVAENVARFLLTNSASSFEFYLIYVCIPDAQDVRRRRIFIFCQARLLEILAVEIDMELSTTQISQIITVRQIGNTKIQTI